MVTKKKVRTNKDICYLICFRHLIRSRALAKGIFSPKKIHFRPWMRNMSWVTKPSNISTMLLDFSFSFRPTNQPWHEAWICPVIYAKVRHTTEWRLLRSKSSNYLGRPQKSSYFNDPATKRGGGGKGLATKKKKTFFETLKNKALVAGPLKKKIFFAASLTRNITRDGISSTRVQFSS